MGTSETRSLQRLSKTDIVLWRQIPMGRDQDLCNTDNLKRGALQGRSYQLSWLLQWASCFEVKLNRRMPNGTYGGVRGGWQNPPTRLASRTEALLFLTVNVWSKQIFSYLFFNNPCVQPLLNEFLIRHEHRSNECFSRARYNPHARKLTYMAVFKGCGLKKARFLELHGLF